MVLADDYQVISSLTGEQGLEVLEQIMAIPAPPPVVMLTVYPDVNLIVAAIKVGACLRLYKCRLETIQRSQRSIRTLALSNSHL